MTFYYTSPNEVVLTQMQPPESGPPPVIDNTLPTPPVPVDPGYSPPWAQVPVDPAHPWVPPSPPTGPVDPGYGVPIKPVDPGYSPPWAQVPNAPDGGAGNWVWAWLPGHGWAWVRVPGKGEAGPKSGKK